MSRDQIIRIIGSLSIIKALCLIPSSAKHVSFIKGCLTFYTLVYKNQVIEHAHAVSNSQKTIDSKLTSLIIVRHPFERLLKSKWNEMHFKGNSKVRV